MHKTFQKIALMLLTLGVSPALARIPMNMPQGATELSHKIYDLHMLIFYITVAIGVVVFGIMIYSLIKHRKSRGVKPAEFHESVTVEIIWTIIPFLILIGMAIPATIVLKRMHDTKDSDMSVEVTGYQWKWQYKYLDDDINFFSNLSSSPEQIHNTVPKGTYYLHEVDQPLVVPIKKKIRLLFTAHDVIHSWWVPELGVKKDAIPGFINESWMYIDHPGVYRGQCTELCGAGHGYMPVVVKAVSDGDYQKWVGEQKALAQKRFEETEKVWKKDELMAKGQKDYITYCGAACHQPNGTGVQGVFPALKGSKIATGPLKNHLHIVLTGKAGTAMQAFGPQLSDAQIAAIITYERNAWGNNTGDVVQPKQIQEAREAIKKESE